MVAPDSQPSSTDLTPLGRRTRAAWKQLALTVAERRTACLQTLAALLVAEEATVLAANAQDVAAASAAGLNPAMLERLTLNGKKLAGMAATVRGLASETDPIGEVVEARELPNGLRLTRKRVPLGVMAVIYESRPNVTIDIAALALRTGNAAILRGGKETLATNRVLIELVHRAMQTHDLPKEAIAFVDDPDRAVLLALLKLGDFVDVVVPRGGAQLQQLCREQSQVPVITGGIGICHLFVDESADLARSLTVLQNAKVQRPSVCNALDTALIHHDVAATFVPLLIDTLGAEGVRFRVDPNVRPFLAGRDADDAGPDDFDTEWLGLTLGVRVVTGLDEAIEHIEAHGSGHSDGILTEDATNAATFLNRVDSAVVFVNASTRFNDGEQMGLGGEVAVSTQRLHVRGPMGLRELTTTKWLAEGDYHVRS